MMEQSVPVKFALVGLLCAATHIAIVLGADQLGIHYVLSCIMSYVVVVMLGFALHTGFTFHQPAGLNSFVRYAVAMAANYPVTLALLFLMCDIAGWPVAIAAPVATVLMMVWNYLASRWAIVRKGTDIEPASSTRIP